jgi:hypothetical protein
MTINEGLRLIAGFFVLASVVLGYLVSPRGSLNNRIR